MGSQRLLYKTLSGGPVFWDALKPETLLVESSDPPGHKTTKNINPPDPVFASRL